MSKQHELKTWPEYFQQVWDGNKLFEIRKNDRDFKVGDTLKLMEYFPSNQSYSGRELIVTVTYVLQGYAPVDGSFVVMGIRRASPSPGWIKASERLPEDAKRWYVFRQAGNTRSAKTQWFEHIKGNVEHHLKLPLYNIEWLDESTLSESPAKPEGEGLRIALEFVRNLYELKDQTPEVSHLIGEFEKFVYNHRVAAHSPAREDI